MVNIMTMIVIRFKAPAGPASIAAVCDRDCVVLARQRDLRHGSGTGVAAGDEYCAVLADARPHHHRRTGLAQQLRQALRRLDGPAKAGHYD